MFIIRRRFLPELDAPWVEEWRHRLELVHQRALTPYAEACLGTGAPSSAGRNAPPTGSSSSPR